MLRYSLFSEVRNGGIGALDLKLSCCDLQDVLKKSEVRLVEAWCWLSSGGPILRKVSDLFLLLYTLGLEELQLLGDPFAVFDDLLTFLDFLG